MRPILEDDERQDHIELGNITDRLFEHTDSNVSFSRTPPKCDVPNEILTSLGLILDSKLNILFVCGPLAVIGNASGIFGEALCFCLAGIALIPCAERLSFITEQVAEHTNETIGALLNATFGNAPEFLISSSALRAEFYRVVQLTLLGSMLTNLLFVFGVSCLIGGLQWQVQELRITSGNVSIGMLLMTTMGLLLPAALKLGNQSIHSQAVHGDDEEITQSDVDFSRANALFMVIGYVGYLIFQLGSHKEEFDYDGENYAVFGGGHNIVRTPHFTSNPKKTYPRRNVFCRQHCFLMRYCPDLEHEPGVLRNKDDTEESTVCTNEIIVRYAGDPQCAMKQSNQTLLDRKRSSTRDVFDTKLSQDGRPSSYDESATMRGGSNMKCHDSDKGTFDEDSIDSVQIMTMRMGLAWLGLVTVVISILSDIIVETIDGFAARSPMSEVFISVIIIPFFSNIAEQVSAVIFAFKNKMDLCIGVTVGSAIQIGQFVMPGCVLVGWIIDKDMTLYFRTYETVCLLLGVLCVAAVLQGGTTNWLVGLFMMSIFAMISVGFAYHENEDLSNGT